MIRARLFDANGAGIGDDLVVPDTTLLAGNQLNADVAGLTGGGFVVTREDTDSSSNRDIRAAIFDNSGAVVVSNIDVRATADGSTDATSRRALGASSIVDKMCVAPTDSRVVYHEQNRARF